MKQNVSFLLLLFFSLLLFCAPQKSRNAESSETELRENTAKKIPLLTAREELEIFRKAYPFVKFEFDYDKEISDWILTVTSYGKTTVFYRCDGLYLPKEQVKNRDHYWRVIYNYQRTLTDPAEFTEEQKERIRKYSSDENRKKGAVSSKFIFDAIYDCFTRASTEKHLRSMTLWNKPLNVNRVVGEALDRVEAKVLEIAKADREVSDFLKNLSECSGYNWRQIRDSPTKSFHSYGIAVDILPRGWGSKVIYWAYEKQKGNKDWMLIPLSRRWMPPAAVVKAFEEEGFIWGGRWAVWDNMHFEYHPELLIAGKYYK